MLSNDERTTGKALEATILAALAIHCPALSVAIQGWDKYRGSRFELYARRFLMFLYEKVASLEVLLSNEWLNSQDGQQYARKILEAATDGQLEDKHELFAHLFINGVQDQAAPYLEKLKFVDMVRHLSFASLCILAEMHKVYRRESAVEKNPRMRSGGACQITEHRMIDELAGRFDPFLVESAMAELQAVGVLSHFGSWKEKQGRFRATEISANAVVFTPFAEKFVRYIGAPRKATNQ